MLRRSCEFADAAQPFSGTLVVDRPAERAPHAPPACRDDARDRSPARVVVPHAWDCEPRRPPRVPRFLPRPALPDGQLPQILAEGWHSPVVRFADDGGARRINFNYRASVVTSADFSLKAGGQMYGEGFDETFYKRLLEVDADTVDFQFQTPSVVWFTSRGAERVLTLDGTRWTEDGREVAFEQKAHEAFFQEPNIKEKLRQAERVLAAEGIELDRVNGQELQEPIRQRVVNQIYDECRLVDWTERQEDAVAGLLARDGVTTRGAAIDALGTSRKRAESILGAMLVRRVVAFPVDRPLDDATPVRRPRDPGP